jgi:hypothetical protein
VSLRRRIAFFLRGLFGYAPSGMDHSRWSTIDDEPRGDPLFRPQANRPLAPVAPHGCEPRDQLERFHSPRRGLPQGRLMIEAT